MLLSGPEAEALMRRIMVVKEFELRRRCRARSTKENAGLGKREEEDHRHVRYPNDHEAQQSMK